MTKADLVNAVAETGLTRKQAGEAVNAVLDGIIEALQQGDKVQLIGFGSFSVKSREARVGRNPKTGDVLNIDARNIPVFKPGEALKAAVN
ncbi:HU family DNA-binding protein [bacterium]|nr:HU family DNA-binding protein [bacterium]MBU1753965.1 HU family DNA-binding protein [bacterium]